MGRYKLYRLMLRYFVLFFLDQINICCPLMLFEVFYLFLFRTKIFIRHPRTLFATEDAFEVCKHELGKTPLISEKQKAKPAVIVYIYHLFFFFFFWQNKKERKQNNKPYKTVRLKKNKAMYVQHNSSTGVFFTDVRKACQVVKNLLYDTKQNKTKMRIQ